MDSLAFSTAGDPAAIISTTVSALGELGYSALPGADGWSGTAEVGSAVGRALLGGFSRRMKLEYSLAQGAADGQFVVTVHPAMTGASGGAIGMSKAKKEFESVRATIGGALQNAGFAVY